MTKSSIALVDDEKDITATYGELLQDDFEVMTFNSPAEFLIYLGNFSESPFEAVVSDFKMKEMTGLEMIQKAKSFKLYFPSMLLSGHIDKSVLLEATSSGVVRFLEKPVEFDQLIMAIKKLILDFRIYKTRQEIREILTQLREAYTTIRIIAEVQSKDGSLDKILSQNKIGGIEKTEGFQSLLDSLESRLDTLLNSEASLETRKLEDRA